MRQVEKTLELTVHGVTREREDRWAVTSKEFGFTVYAQTEIEAEKNFQDALVTLINSFADDSMLRDYLDKKGVQHRFAEKSPSLSERTFERRFEVTIGAAA